MEERDPVSASSNGRLLTAEEVAQVLGMTVDFVYSLCRRDQIPHLRFGRTLRFRSEAVEGWLCASERGTLRRSSLNGAAPRKRPAPGTGGIRSHAGSA